MLGGKFRDKVRMYCDTDATVPSGTETGKRLKERMDLGFTFLKMDLGLMQVVDTPGSVVSPAGSLEGYRIHPSRGSGKTMDDRRARNAVYDVHNVRHPFTGLNFTEQGLELLEEYIHQVREVIGYEIPSPSTMLATFPCKAASASPSASRDTPPPGSKTSSLGNIPSNINSFSRPPQFRSAPAKTSTSRKVSNRC